jgi:GNAT superfamily N-acetyltransferase
VPDSHHVLIRPARPHDADQVWPLARDFASSFTLERESFDATWRSVGAARGTLVAVAASSGREVVGYLLASCHLTFLANGPVAWVEEVMVDEGHRRTGVGRELMGYAENWARENGAAYLALASRRAGPFYAALGYDDSAVFYKKTLSRTTKPPHAR